MIERATVRNWLFKGLMFESEAERFRSAGIRVGADQSDEERSLLEETLAPFGIDLRNEALQMARIYALTYCFENSVRALITQRLQERYGTDKWTSKIPSKILTQALARQTEAQENSWLEGQKGIYLDLRTLAIFLRSLSRIGTTSRTSYPLNTGLSSASMNWKKRGTSSRTIACYFQRNFNESKCTSTIGIEWLAYRATTPSCLNCRRHP